MRHSIVPHSYRKYFDLKYKSRSSHDIVLLCRICTEKVGIEDGRFRSVLAYEMKIPLEGEGPTYIVDPVLTKIRSKAVALSRHPEKLPTDRREELERELKEHLQKNEITAEDIKSITKIEPKTKNPNHKSHEELVVEALKTHEDVETFVKRWRSHFLASMKPKFLPDHWNVDRPLDMT
jgi:hypothetical protein